MAIANRLVPAYVALALLLLGPCATGMTATKHHARARQGRVHHPRPNSHSFLVLVPELPTGLPGPRRPGRDGATSGVVVAPAAPTPPPAAPSPAPAPPSPASAPQSACAPFKPQDAPALLVDDFGRADTSATLGAPAVGPVWPALVGPGAASAGISGHRFTSPDGTTYAPTTLAGTPTHAGVGFVLLPDATGATVVGMALGHGPMPFDPTAMSMLHLYIAATSFGLTKWVPGTPNVPLEQPVGMYYPVLTTGERYVVDLYAVGSRACVELTDETAGTLVGSIAGGDSAIAGIVGSLDYWEPTPGVAITSAYAG